MRRMAFLPSLWHAFAEIFRAPFLGQHLWWQLGPVLVLWLIVEIYLDCHKGERLGWNTALGNAISLFWISLAAMQPLFTVPVGESFPYGRFFAILPILAYALFVGYVSFSHVFGERVTYALAYPTIVYYLCVFAILWGNKALDVNRYVLLAAALLFGVVYGLRWLFFWLLPDAEGAFAGSG